MMSSAPKEYKRYRSCIKSKCRSERKSIMANRHKLEKGMKHCLLSKKTYSGRKKCFKKFNNCFHILFIIYLFNCLLFSSTSWSCLDISGGKSVDVIFCAVSLSINVLRSFAR